MLALKTTPVILVPGDPKKAWVPLLASIVSDTVAGAYATAATITLGGIAFTLAHSGLSSGAVDMAWAYDVAAVNNTAQSGLVNVPIELTADADPTGGNVANRVTVKVFFTEMDALL